MVKRAPTTTEEVSSPLPTPFLPSQRYRDGSGRTGPSPTPDPPLRCRPCILMTKAVGVYSPSRVSTPRNTTSEGSGTF